MSSAQANCFSPHYSFSFFFSFSLLVLRQNFWKHFFLSKMHDYLEICPWFWCIPLVIWCIWMNPPFICVYAFKPIGLQLIFLVGSAVSLRPLDNIPKWGAAQLSLVSAANQSPVVLARCDGTPNPQGLLLKGYAESGRGETQRTKSRRCHGLPNHCRLWRLRTGLGASPALHLFSRTWTFKWWL